MPTESNPVLVNLGTKTLENPVYLRAKAAKIEGLVRDQADVVAKADAELQVLPVLLEGRGLPEAEPYVEQPWHRHAAYYYATGMDVKTVARMCDVEDGAVYKLIRRPQFQANVSAILEANGVNDIMTLFKAELQNSFATLIEIRDNPKVAPKVRADVSTAIIERIYGKAKQDVSVTQRVSYADPVMEEARLIEEIKSLG